jgi:hypothetical protein
MVHKQRIIEEMNIIGFDKTEESSRISMMVLEVYKTKTGFGGENPMKLFQTLCELIKKDEGAIQLMKTITQKPQYIIVD